MEEVLARWDRTFAPLYRAGRRRPERLFDDRRLKRESIVRPVKIDELLKLLKLDEIKLFLVQVRSQFGHRSQDEERDQCDKTNRAIYLKNERYHPTTWFRIPSLMPNRYNNRSEIDSVLTKMWRRISRQIDSVLYVNLHCYMMLIMSEAAFF
jgi:hypothetical protein